MKSSYSKACGNCVEAGLDDDGNVVVWHSKQPDAGRPRIRYTRDEWDAFIAGVKNGEFDYGKLPAGGEPDYRMPPHPPVVFSGHGLDAPWDLGAGTGGHWSSSRD